MFSGWVNRHQLDVIEYLQEEDRVLKERLGGRRIHFTATDMAAYAVAAWSNRSATDTKLPQPFASGGIRVHSVPSRTFSDIKRLVSSEKGLVHSVVRGQ
jgi:hypothetical protein